MWPFKKKAPDKSRKLIVLGKGPGGIIPTNSEELKRFTTRHCPEIHVHAQTCVCVSCPQRLKGCSLEEIFQKAGCRVTFLTSCSYKKHLLGQLEDNRKEIVNGEKEDLGLAGILLGGYDTGCNGACFSGGEGVLGG